VLLAHFDFPAEHWIHLRTTDAIGYTFATVRLRARKTKGARSRTAGLAMAYKLLTAAQARWRSVNAPHLVALVRAGGDLRGRIHHRARKPTGRRVIITGRSTTLANI
jgi:putative transposase